MIDAPLAYAFTVGMVATVNPCGFPMLPAYLSYFVGLDDHEAGTSRVPRAAASGLAVSLGFVATFGILGVPINAGLTAIYRWVPYVSIALGLLLVILGVAMLRGRPVALALPHLDRTGTTRRFWSMVGFGVSYALASLSCTIPLFLSVVAVGSNQGFGSGMATYLAYGLGMSTVLMALAVTVALAQGSLLRWLRASGHYVERVAGGLLVAVGAYLVFYWSFNLVRDPADVVGRNPISIVGEWSSAAAAWLGGGGAARGVALGAVVAALVAGAVLRTTVSAGRRPR